MNLSYAFNENQQIEIILQLQLSGERQKFGGISVSLSGTFFCAILI